MGQAMDERTRKSLLAKYEALRAQGCGFALSMMEWRCRDREPSAGHSKPCKHIIDAIPNWREVL